MKYIFVLFLVFATHLMAKDEIDIKIHKASSKLTTFAKSYSSINAKMSRNAKAIIEQKRKLQKQNKRLKELKKVLKTKEKNYYNDNKKLKKLDKSQKSLQKVQSKVEEDLVFVIAQNITLSIILDQNYTTSEESLIEYEVLHEMLKKSKNKIKNLNSKFYANTQKMQKLSDNVSTLKKAIASIDAKKMKILKLKNQIKSALYKLKSDKYAYKSELEKLLKKQDSIKKTLAGLNIIKIDKIKKERERKAREAAFERERLSKNETLPKIKQLGTSYQAIKTKRYYGKKTIAPLSSYTITKKYGTYTDPVYGIKIFNESISLKPKYKHAKVKTVFNGKVIYADKTAVLKNIVIIEHRNGLHTIYANLSKIAPNIKKGTKIKKGYTIGRVDEELIFEVTQKSQHINPIRLFQ